MQIILSQELWKYTYRIIKPIILSFPVYIIGLRGWDVFCLSLMMTVPFLSNSVFKQLFQGYTPESALLWLPVLYTIWEFQLVRILTFIFKKLPMWVIKRPPITRKYSYHTFSSKNKRKKIDIFKQPNVFLYPKPPSRNNMFTFLIIIKNWFLNDFCNVPAEKSILNVKK